MDDTCLHMEFNCLNISGYYPGQNTGYRVDNGYYMPPGQQQQCKYETRRTSGGKNWDGVLCREKNLVIKCNTSKHVAESNF